MRTVMSLLFIVIAFTTEAKPATTKWPYTISLPVCIQDTTLYKEYTGLYKFKENELVKEVTVKIEDKGLVAIDDEDNVYTLTPDKDKADSFTIPQIGAAVSFTRSAEKKVTGIKIILQGGELIGNKQVN